MTTEHLFQAGSLKYRFRNLEIEHACYSIKKNERKKKKEKERLLSELDSSELQI